MDSCHFRNDSFHSWTLMPIYHRSKFRSNSCYCKTWYSFPQFFKIVLDATIAASIFYEICNYLFWKRNIVPFFQKNLIFSSTWLADSENWGSFLLLNLLLVSKPACTQSYRQQIAPLSQRGQYSYFNVLSLWLDSQ